MIKRGFDMVVSAAAIALLSPLLAAIAIAVAVGIGRPILFVQERAGLHGRIFRMYKFRTMTNTVDARGVPLPDAERLTPLGKLLRSTSLDEMPELWNVLRGDMSLVGPRPLLVRYLPRYSVEQARRHEARPGLTGLAQVNGRNALSWDRRFELDTWYVDNQSLLLDLKILALTVIKVFDRSGINSSADTTMTEFMGPEDSERQCDEPAPEQHRVSQLASAETRGGR